MSDSSHQRVLITGASSGIGRATALALAQAGFDLVLVSRSYDRLQAIADQLQQQGKSVEIYPMDLSEIDQVCDRIAAIVDASGPIDILINNAGMGYTNSLIETSLTDWQRVLDLNLTSTFQCIRGVVPAMRARQRGLIVNVTSIASHQVFPNWGAYSVSKFGVLALSKALAAEERAYGIRVTVVCPGAVNTPLWDTDTVQADFDRAAMLTPEAVAEAIVHAVSLPKSAVVEEIILMPGGGAF